MLRMLVYSVKETPFGEDKWFLMLVEKTGILCDKKPLYF
jgi:hypothetical protein